MTHPFSRLTGLAIAGFMTLTILTACNPNVNAQAKADAYIRANISQLSPEPAVLGGTFYVTNIEWEDDDTALVTYEDGHIMLTARAEIVVDGEDVDVDSFVIVDDYGYGDSGSSASALSNASQRPLSAKGEFCGGIAAFQCEDGLTCILDGDYPDAGGTCQ